MFCSLLQPCQHEAQRLPNLLSLFNYVTALASGRNPSRPAPHSCPASRHFQLRWAWEACPHIPCLSGVRVVSQHQGKDMAWIQLRSEALGPQHPGLWSRGDTSQALEEKGSGSVGCPHPSWHARSPEVPAGICVVVSSLCSRDSCRPQGAPGLGPAAGHRQLPVGAEPQPWHKSSSDQPTSPALRGQLQPACVWGWCLNPAT